MSGRKEHLVERRSFPETCKVGAKGIDGGRERRGWETLSEGDFLVNSFGPLRGVLSCASFDLVRFETLFPRKIAFSEGSFRILSKAVFTA